MMKQLLKTLLPKSLSSTLARLYRTYITRYAQASYAQEGEDLILLELLNEKSSGGGGGIYIDIGAHHPFRFSNTYALYKRGWRGINIDAMPGSMRLFDRFRRRDINLEIGIGAESSELNFYIFEEGALNTFDPALAKAREAYSKLQHIQKVQVLPINQILSTHLPQDTPIDLLTIDVEGMDLEILKSLDWQTYAPSIVLAESYEEDLQKDSIYTFMTLQGYTLRAKTSRTYIFQKH